ncbi:MAG: 1-acyl-sn-glycerol-3-phosphate acyltransferase [Myxococcota bacterium]
MVDAERLGPGRPSRWLERFVRERLRPAVELLYRPCLEGAEHLPPAGTPFLLVANHSAGMAVAECLSFAVLYATEVGAADRPLAGFTHEIGFRFPPLAWLWREVGAIPSTYEAAAAALAARVPILVFPGGDHESLRPLWQASRVDFAGRRGFLRIAREAGVPIVPMGIVGSHVTAPMLFRSRALARWLVIPRLMGLNRWGVSLLGVLGTVGLARARGPRWLRLGLGWVWVATPLCLLPIFPSKIRFRIGSPLSPEVLFRDGDPELDGAYALVEGAVQDLVDALRRRP